MAEALIPLDRVSGLVFCFSWCLLEILKYGLNAIIKLWCEKVVNIGFPTFWERLTCLISLGLYHKINFLTCTDSWQHGSLFINFLQDGNWWFYLLLCISRVLCRSYWRVAVRRFDILKGLCVQKCWQASGVFMSNWRGKNGKLLKDGLYFWECSIEVTT